MVTNFNNVTFHTCDGCVLGDIVIGGEWVFAHEAVESLSSVYPKDTNDRLLDINDEQLDTIRLSEIDEWREIEDSDFGKGVADFLEKTPEIVRANYDCDMRRQLGKCALRPRIDQINGDSD